MRIRCTVERYSYPPPGEREVIATRALESTGCHVRYSRGEPWLYLRNSAASISLKDLRRAVEQGGWLAQAGTRPVYVEPCEGAPRPCGPGCGCGPGEDLGGWGGRNYPEIYVDGPELATVLEAIEKETIKP